MKGDGEQSGNQGGRPTDGESDINQEAVRWRRRDRAKDIIILGGEGSSYRGSFRAIVTLAGGEVGEVQGHKTKTNRRFQRTRHVTLGVHK